MNKELLILILSVFTVIGCGNNKKAEHFTALPFPEVKVPSMVSSEKEILNFLSEHFWDNLLDPSRAYPSDSVLVTGVNKNVVEQRFVDWLLIIDNVSQEQALKAVSRLYSGIDKCEKTNSSSNVFETFVELMERYLYDPNSPFREEDRYHEFVKRLSKSDFVDSVMKEKYARESRMTSLNRIGTHAADFRFMDKRGNTMSLYDIDAPFTLLFFSNPGCEACLDIIRQLTENPSVSKLISEKGLAVANIYIDEDIESWRSYMPIYPENWYNGFDFELAVRNDVLYDVRAIPSLYLLDKDKKVILKDTPEQKLYRVLENII